MCRDWALRVGARGQDRPHCHPGSPLTQLVGDPETLRNWVRQAEIDGGVRAGTTTADGERIAKFEQEVPELRRANHILKTASAFFAAELDRPTSR